MSPTFSSGRVVGILLLLHLAGGLILPYVVLGGAVAPPGFLENAAPNAAFVRAAVLLLLLGAAIALAVSVVAYPALQRDSPRLALTCLALGIANLPLQAVECGALLSMLSLSQRYALMVSADGPMLQVVADAVGSARIWAHFTQLLAIGSWILVLCAALWKAALVPRALALAGVIACVLQIGGVPMRALLGYGALTWMAVPLAPAYLGLALRLIVKGFARGPKPN